MTKEKSRETVRKADPKNTAIVALIIALVIVIIIAIVVVTCRKTDSQQIENFVNGLNDKNYSQVYDEMFSDELKLANSYENFSAHFGEANFDNCSFSKTDSLKYDDITVIDGIIDCDSQDFGAQFTIQNDKIKSYFINMVKAPTTEE
ncbi:MAG: hypothetical protein LBK50_00835 [Candidatus Nomurabacteria bacterium]|jgi:signal transduction histidine kinase|nr:hypothetical protein [Candidatus Nomurabacteria bacterium]